jgi:single-strand DNA-binding protein
MLNRVVLIGRLTRDPELRYSPSGVAVTNFTLAVDRRFKNAQGEKETDFIPCVVFKQLAELCANYLAKGKLASVDGRIQVRNYNDKDGQKRWVTEVIAEDVHFLSPKDSGSGSTEAGPPSRTGSFGHEVNLDDDIPF